MTFLIPIILIIVGLIILIGSAESMVRGASSLASKFGISPLVIGLTVVAFGTSAPELIANIFSSIKGASDIGIGNIVGSNISNILLILGIGAIIFPLKIKSNTVWKEIPFALLAAILVFVMGNDVLFKNSLVNQVSKSEGITLLFIFIIFMYYVFGMARNKNVKTEKVHEYSGWISAGLALIGIVGLFIGGNLLVDNAVILAEIAGLSEVLIGLTIVAIGTSLPELATVIAAARHKQSDMAVGNIIGSNIFNVFWILGLVSFISPIPYNTSLNFDVLVAVGATSLLFSIMFIGKKHILTKREGVLFVSLYIGYMILILLRG